MNYHPLGMLRLEDPHHFLTLSDRPGVSVKDKTAFTIGLVNSFKDQPVDQFVRNQRTGFHSVRDRGADRIARPDMLPQHVSG